MIWVISTIFLIFYSTYSSAASVFEEGVLCPVVSDSGITKKDYRLRDSTDLRPRYNDNYRNHMAPALQRMKEGSYSRIVMADLDFTLRRWPNHYAALQALIAYERGGGAANILTPVSCYFQRAYRFVPEDANIFILYGIYNHKQRRYDVAESAWLFALQIDDQSMEAHYNLGLLFHRLERFSESLEHARIAYSLGYPLPGLKEKLASAGYWTE